MKAKIQFKVSLEIATNESDITLGEMERYVTDHVKKTLDKDVNVFTTVEGVEVELTKSRLCSIS
jgi:hypothetical protein